MTRFFQKNVQKIGLFVSLLSLMAFLVGCGGSNSASDAHSDHSHDSSDGGESTIEVTNVWARPAEVMMMDEMDKEDEAANANSNEEDQASHEHEHNASGSSHNQSGTNSALYLMLKNKGDQENKLLHVHANEVAEFVELHQTTIENDVMKMQPIENGLPVAAGEEVELKPGSYHIMLINLKRDLVVGDRFEVQLHFEHGGEMTVEAEVRQQ